MHCIVMFSSQVNYTLYQFMDGYVYDLSLGSFLGTKDTKYIINGFCVTFFGNALQVLFVDVCRLWCIGFALCRNALQVLLVDVCRLGLPCEMHYRFC